MGGGSPNAGQQWSAHGYAANARFVADLGAPLLDMLNPQPGETILDLGCGDGALTEKIASTGATVVGVDASPELLEAARARGLDARLADGHALPFDGEFDAVFSNAALHWMTRPEEVIAGVARALRTGGRFVGEFGGFGNVATITTALLAALKQRGFDEASRIPWFFPTADQYRGILEKYEFRVDEITITPRPTPLPTGMAGWLATFASPFLGGLSHAEGAAILAEAEDLLRPVLLDSTGQWWADYVRLRFAARKIS